MAPSLKKGTVVLLLQPGDRWSKVEVEGPTDIEGWVNNTFIARTAAVPRQRGAMKKGAMKKAPKKPSVRKRSARARR